MKRTEDGGFICPAGYEFEIEKVTIDSRSNYDKINFLFRNNKCGKCPLRNKCTKSKSGRTIVHSYQMEEYQKEVKRNIRSEDGIRLMYQRSNETEGTFGDWKNNHQFERLHRRGENGVKLEIYLVAIGHNIRKYHRYKIQKQKTEKVN